MFGLKSWWVCVSVCVCIRSRQLTSQLWSVSDRSKGSTCSVFSFFFCWMTSGLKKAIHATMLKWWGDEMARLIAILKREKNITRSPFIRLKSYITASDIVLTKINLSLSLVFFFPPHTFSHPHTHAGGNSGWHTYGHMLYITESLCDCGLSVGFLATWTFETHQWDTNKACHVCLD